MARHIEKAFSNMKKHAEKMRFERTGLIPTCAEDYVNLKKWYKETGDEYKQKKMEQNIWDLEMAKKQDRELARVFGGKIIGDSNAGVLGLHTVWARSWTPTKTHPLAPWPSPREFCEEGDERYTSNYGRYLPIPRLPGNHTVTYKQRSWNPVEPLDKVMPVPKLYSNVNLNKSGYFDATVDEEGVPYDDDELPGKEYLVEQTNEPHQSDPFAQSDLSSDTKVNTVDYSTKSQASKALISKYPFSQFRPEAAPFIARGAKEDLEVFDNNSSNNMDDAPEKSDGAFKMNIGALLEATNITFLPNTNIDPGSFGHAGIQKGTEFLENDPFYDGNPEETYSHDSFATTEKEKLAAFIGYRAQLRAKAMLESSPRAPFSSLNPVQPRLTASKFKKGSNPIAMETGLQQSEAGSGYAARAHETGYTTSSPNIGRSFGLHKPTSFSSRNRINTPAALQLDKTCLTKRVTSNRMGAPGTTRGINLGVAAKHT